MEQSLGTERWLTSLEEFYALVDSLCPGEFEREIFGRKQHKRWLPPLGNVPDKIEVAND